jgi:hypothetical protein
MNKIWPKDYSHTEILDEVNELFRLAESNQIKPGRVTFLIQRAQIGINYIESKKNSNFNRSAIFIAFFTLFITLVFSVADYFGDKNWQSEQLRVLKEIRESMAVIMSVE